MSAHPTFSRRFVAVITMAVLAMAAFAPSASAATAKEKALRRKINNYRDDNGKSRLKLADKLVNHAHKQAKKMADDGRFDPVSDHSSTGELQDLAGRANCSSIAEIIASTDGTRSHTLDDLMTQWKNSPGHNSTMLSSSWKKIGPGVFKDSNGALWAAVIFCKPQ